GGHLRDKVAAHIDGGAARLTEARVSIMQRKTKRRPDACAAGRRRAAPDMRPGKISASTFGQVRAIRGNGLRSRCSCREDSSVCDCALVHAYAPGPRREMTPP